MIFRCLPPNPIDLDHEYFETYEFVQQMKQSYEKLLKQPDQGFNS